MVRTKVAFLYSELAGYFLACVETLAQSAEVLIVHWPVNPEAPFEFNPSANLKLMSKADFSVTEIQQKLTDFNPDILVCSGWMDKDYVKLVREFKPAIPKVLTLDNHWEGTWRQYLGVLVSPFFLKRIFSHAWVPGPKQAKFAQKLGFSKTTLTGFYCADVPLFQLKYDTYFSAKKEQFPKRFLYVARYVKHKGIHEMWQAFSELQAEYPNDWELWCIGAGEEWDSRMIHPKIKHIGFVQPKDLDEYTAETGVYILPSTFEPWGVSVQEFAVAGFPLILSQAIGSVVNFMEGNGFLIEPGNVEALKDGMRKIMELSADQLVEMGERSHQLGIKYTPDHWAKKISDLKK